MTRPDDKTPETDDATDRTDVAPDADEAERHPDTPQTMQHDHDGAVGRQRYDNARPGDYSPDFQEDSSAAHPVKPVDGDEVDEKGIPDIAAKEPHESGKD